MTKASVHEQAFAIRLRGFGHQLKRDYPAAIAAFRESLALQQSLSAESAAVAIALNNLAEAEQLSGDFTAAERGYRQALRITRAVNYVEGESYITSNLAELALDQEDWPRAETQAREALSVSEKIGRQKFIASNSQRIAQALVRQGKVAEARPYAQRAVEIFTWLGVAADIEGARATLDECDA